MLRGGHVLSSLRSGHEASQQPHPEAVRANGGVHAEPDGQEQIPGLRV